MAAPRSALLLALVLLAPTVAAAPAWYEQGLATLFDQLGNGATGALDETPAPIDHGDVWAWTGDNGKALDALARSDLAGTPRADALAGFLAAMSEGPILFKRRFDPAPVTLVQNDGAGFELSNHLITLRGAWADGRVAMVVEYHDGRDKTFVHMAPASARVAGRWIDLAPLRVGGEASVAPDGRSGAIAFRYAGDGIEATETWALDAQPAVHHALTVLRGDADAVRLVAPALDVAYRNVTVEGGPSAPLRDVALAPPGAAWSMLVDPGRTDEFASGLLTRYGPGFAGATATALREDGTPRGLADLYGPAASEDVTPLDGVLVEDPAAYAPIVADLAAGRLAGIDPALTYELGETALGAVDYARATGNASLAARAAQWIDGYAARAGRGTQARELAAASLSALRLGDLPRAEAMGALLESYQQAKGGVRSDPEGRASVDATAMAIRAWGELAARNATFAEPLARAVASVRAAPEGVAIAQDDGGADETDFWTFKSGLVLQAADFLPDDARWAAREHAWASIRDAQAAEVRTSVYAAETNSETQAWALLGLLVDEQRGDLPAVPFAEGSWALARDAGSVRLAPPWPDARLDVDPSWASWAPRAPGPLGTTRYQSEGAEPVVLWPARQEALPAGLDALAFPGLDAPRPPAQLLSGLPVSVAWAWRDGGWRAWVPNGPSTLAEVRPGDVVLAWLDAPATRGVPDLAAPAAPGGPPPFLAWGAVPTRGGDVAAYVEGKLVARGASDAQGFYALPLDAPPGAQVELRASGASGWVVAQPGGAARADLQAVAAAPSFPWLWGLLLVGALAASGLALVWRVRHDAGEGSNAGPPT